MQQTLTEKNREQIIGIIQEITLSESLPNGDYPSIQKTAKYLQSLYLPYYFDRGTGEKSYFTFDSLCRLVQKHSHKIGKPERRVRVKQEPVIETNISLDDEFNFEDGESFEFFPYVFKDEKRMGIVSDIHVPFHDIEAVKVAFRYLKEAGIDSLLMNGDILDFMACSKFIKNPTKKLLRDELILGERFMKEVRRYFPNQKIYFKLGNHEKRLDTYIYDKAPELYQVRGLDFESLLGLKDLGITMIDQHRVMNFGHLNIIHGHENRQGGGTINVARQMRLKARENVLFGHFHKTNYDPSRSINGKITAGWAVGCLCKLNPEYLPMNEWNHGFAMVIRDGDAFEVENKTIVNGKVK